MYCMQTAEIYVALYPWFCMTFLLHKILIHGADIINHVSLPIGMMSEEAQESRNKDIRNFRVQHTRKTGMILFSSDSFISSISKCPSLHSRNQVIVDNNVQNLLLEQNIQEDSFCSYNSDSD